MSPSPKSRSRRSRRAIAGMTLAEVLVALTVFVVAAAVALILYNALTQSYKRGDNATEAQQNTRVAFENLLTDLRMAGFNYNPDGATRPDEQVEGAWETAITVRGDFDFEDPTLSKVPETLLASGGSPYNVVSTGNDEIVTYALAKPDGTGGTSLTFKADVTPLYRDGVVETVTIGNVALVQNDPPYTLYRITVKPNSTQVTKTPVADNITSMRFTYYDAGDAQVGPSTPSDPSDDIGGAETSSAIATRASIRRIAVSLTGMTPDPDLRYTDSADTHAATRNHRKFTLTQDITPRNLGYVGRADIDTLPPTAPTNVVACPGQCESMLVMWDPAPASDVTTEWTVLRGTSAGSLANPTTTTTNLAYIEGLTDGMGYYFRVRAEDAAGNPSPLSALATPQPATVGDITTPQRPASLTASGGATAMDDKIHLLWPQVTTNVESVACDPTPTKIRDLLGYRLFRGTSAGFTPGPSNAIVEPAGLPPGTGTYDDQNVVACRHYFYDVRAVDKCDHESASPPTQPEGWATTQYVPEAPTGLQAIPSGSTDMQLRWNRVTQNTNGDPIGVDRYRVYRMAMAAGLSPSAAASADWSVAYWVDVPVPNPSSPASVDSGLYPLSPGQSYYYRVAALTDCPDPLDKGAPSAPAEGVACTFGGTILQSPADGATVVASTTVSVSVSGSDVYTGFTIITNSGGTVVGNYGSGAAPVPVPYTTTWNTSGLPPGTYHITSTVTNSSGCSDSTTSTVTVNPATACCIAPLAPVLGPTTGKLSERLSDVEFSLVNNCAQDVSVTGQDISWTNVTGDNTKLDDICYDIPPATLPENCAPIVSFVPSKASPAAVTHSPALSFPAGRDSSDPLIVGYKFSASLISGDLGETITVTMTYRLPGATSDSACTFLVQTNPLSVGTSGP